MILLKFTCRIWIELGADGLATTAWQEMVKGCEKSGDECLQIKVLDDSAYKWLHEMLNCFNDGDMHKYDRLCTQYASVLNKLPSMVKNERKLREKITILALTELIFK
jgi:hypothetical protein